MAQAKIVHANGRTIGVLPSPAAAAKMPEIPIGPSAFTVGGNQPAVTYHNGAVMHSQTLYLIFWGPSGSFPSTYSGPIIQYAKDLAADSGKTTNEYSVATTYYGGASKVHLTSTVKFGGYLMDTTPYPTQRSSECPASLAHCVGDDQMQQEILNDINAQGWPTDSPNSPTAQYLVYTPSSENSCDATNDCSGSGFCAYHGQVGPLSDGTVATYSNLPYVSACDSGQAPAGTDHNADADGTLDSEIHELLESATDPAPDSGWIDANGNEVGDKCTNPVVNAQMYVYGPVLGGYLSGDSAYNQVINGHTYYTQQIWTQVGTSTPSSAAEAGCMQRTGPSPSMGWTPSTPAAGASVTFTAFRSLEVAHPITSYTWNFGDGTTASGSRPTHAYAADGRYNVTLTAKDATGTAVSQTRVIVVSG